MSKEPREYFEEKIESQLEEIRAEIDDLVYERENAPWDAGTDVERELATFRLRLEELEKMLRELRAASNAAWPSIREELEGALAGLETALDKASPEQAD